MITANSGLQLNNNFINGYRFIFNNSETPWQEKHYANKGRVLLFIIDGVVEYIDIVYSPLADLLLAGQNNIVDMENLTVQITANETIETIVFEPEDEAKYAMLVSNPLIIEQTHECTNDCHKVQTPGWKWNGKVFHQ